MKKLKRWQKWLTLSMLPKEMKEQIADVLKELDLYDKRKQLAGSLS
ncbi:MAG: hypothetical protein WCJ81_03705 [bacterium]